MFYAPKETIEDIYQYFKDKFPDISNEVLYKRISNNYEGGIFNIWTIEHWDKVLHYKDYGKLLTVFENWDEYLKYDGDYRKHPKYIARKGKEYHLH